MFPSKPYQARMKEDEKETSFGHLVNIQERFVGAWMLVNYAVHKLILNSSPSLSLSVSSPRKQGHTHTHYACTSR